jgi:hypothetical protein
MVTGNAKQIKPTALPAGRHSRMATTWVSSLLSAPRGRAGHAEWELAAATPPPPNRPGARRARAAPAIISACKLMPNE